MSVPVASAAMLPGMRAGGLQVHPRLTLAEPAGEAHESIFKPDVFGRGRSQVAVAEPLLEEIREGMFAVVNSPRGTGRQAFSGNAALAKKIYAKTGTAQVGIAGRGNTGWFIGWVEGLGTGHLADRRVAFACAISEMDPARGTGGNTCAPLIRSVLERIEAAETRTAGGAASAARSSAGGAGPFCNSLAGGQ